MKRLENIEVEDSKLIDNIPDSDYNRREYIRLFIKAIECAKDCSYKESFALMERLGYDSCDSIKLLRMCWMVMKHITTTHFFIF